jgi:hypothetical protein
MSSVIAWLVVVALLQTWYAAPCPANGRGVRSPESMKEAYGWLASWQG